MQTFKSVFPFNQVPVGEYPLHTEDEIDIRLTKAEAAFRSWKRRNADDRAAVLNKLAVLLTEQKNALAALITREMGKVSKEAVAEIEKCAVACSFYAEHAEAFLQDVQVSTKSKVSRVVYLPVGAVLGIMPWNFPFWQVFRFAIPTLAAGNVVLLKHAPNVTGCALAMEDLFLQAGAEEGVFQALIIETGQVKRILQHRMVQGVSVTGSERAGSAVASIAGAEIKKSVLELGGSDAFIVFDDADIKLAAATAVNSRMQNAGQSCIAAKRFIVVQDVLDVFVQETKRLIENIKQGNPFDENINMGPVARIDLAKNLERQIKQSTDMGAVLVSGGEVSGCNYTPTMLMQVKEAMPAFDEETFGPLLSVITVQNEREAVKLANSSRFGLGSTVFTKDIEKGILIAKQLESGATFINSMVKSDVRMPFGGVKKSGYGRELGRHGIHEFVNIKTIVAE